MSTMTSRLSPSIGRSHAAPDLRNEDVLLARQGTSTFRLAASESLTLCGSSGRMWVTMERDRKDYALEPGKRLVFHGPGLLVLEGLEESNQAVATRSSL
jgi:hypothetical protein